MALTFDQGLILLLLGIVIGGSLEKKRRNVINQIRKELHETRKIEEESDEEEDGDESRDQKKRIGKPKR